MSFVRIADYVSPALAVRVTTVKPVAFVNSAWIIFVCHVVADAPTVST